MPIIYPKEKWNDLTCIGCNKTGNSENPITADKNTFYFPWHRTCLSKHLQSCDEGE